MTRPTLNYRSKTEAVMALKAQGLGVDAIARRIGSTNMVDAVLDDRGAA